MTFKMTFHNLQNSLIYRLKTQERAFQRLFISKFSQGGKLPDLLARSRAAYGARPPLSLTARYGPGHITLCQY